eukprot:11535718-Alexandrium_andersonii.AAC.1
MRSAQEHNFPRASRVEVGDVGRLSRGKGNGAGPSETLECIRPHPDIAQISEVSTACAACLPRGHGCVRCGGLA